MAAGSLYAADGSWNVTVVDGSTRVGRYAANHSLNVIVSDGTRGATIHPCGATRVTLRTSGLHGVYAPDGSINVSQSPYIPGTLKVTGSFGPTIILSNSSITETSSTGNTVGTLSVINGSGAYTFSITADTSNKVTLTGTSNATMINDQTIDYETLTSFVVGISATNGTGTALTRSFTINVSNIASPSLSAASGTSTGSSTANLSVTTTGTNGTLYTVVSTSAVAPNATQIKAGNDATGSAAAYSGNTSVSSAGAKTFNATGLSGSTNYYAYFMHEGLPSEQSSVASSSVFATDTVVTPAAPVLTWASDSSDDTPDFDVDLPSGNLDGTDAAVGDVLRIQYATQGTSFASPTTYLTDTLDSGDIVADTIPETSSSLASGDYDFRARLERGGTNSAWSSTVQVTIAAGWTTPDESPNLVAWWDFTDNASLTTSLGEITKATDKSGNGYDLNGAAGSYAPALETNIINGLQAAASTPSGSGAKQMISNAFTQTAPYQIFLVYKSGPNAQAQGYPLLLNCVTSGFGLFHAHQDNSGHMLATSDGTHNIVTSFSATTNTPAYVAAVIDGSSSSLNYNGTVTNGNMGSGTESGGLRLGEADDFVGFYFQGWYAECFVIAGNSTDDYDSAIAYIQDKYAL